MAKKISELEAAASVADTDEFEVNQSGTSRKAKRAQIVAGLAASSHQHTTDDITGLGTAATKNVEEFAASTHDHTLADISDAGDAAGKNVGTTAGTVAAGDHSHPDASDSTSGFMSSSDKQKLDGIEASAQVNTVASVHGRTGTVVAAKGDYDAVGLSEDEVSGAKTIDGDDFNRLQRYTGSGDTWTFNAAGAAGIVPIINKGSDAITVQSGTATVEGANSIPQDKAATAVYYGSTGANVLVVVQA